MRSLILPICAILLSSAFFYALYCCGLRKSRQHTLNRCYLLCAFLFSAILPFCHFPLPARFSFVSPVAETAVCQPAATHATALVAPAVSPVSVLYIIYWVGAALFAMLLLMKVLRLTVNVCSKPHRTIGRLKIVDLPNQTTPYSFFNFLIINTSDYQPDEFRTICLHEEAHAKQLHSVDILLLEVVRIFTWFNPMFWLYKKELRTIHEYLADEAVVAGGTSQTAYLQLMLKQVQTQNHLSLGHPFSAELLKSRILMMKNSDKVSLKKWRYAILFPLLVAVVLLYSAFFPPKAVAQVAADSPKTVVSAMTEQPVASPKSEVPARKNTMKHNSVPAEPAVEESSSNVLSGQTWLNQLGTTVDIVDEHSRTQAQPQAAYQVIVVSENGNSFSVTPTDE